jgi:hypothetical protein
LTPGNIGAEEITALGTTIVGIGILEVGVGEGTSALTFEVIKITPTINIII